MKLFLTRTKEFRVWLLQIYLPWLLSLLNVDHYYHYMCLVNWIALLSGDSISNMDIGVAEQVLLVFCNTFTTLCGRFNLLAL